MSSVQLLPLLRVSAGVQADEDFSLSLAFYLSDGITPINLSGLTFIAKVGVLTTAVSASGALVVSGASNNMLTLTILAATKSSWCAGAYPLSLLASDGVYTRDIFALSTLTVGAPALNSLTTLVAPGGSATSIATATSSALASAIAAAQPATLAVALAALPSSTLAPLAQAVIAALPMEAPGAFAPISSGAYIDWQGHATFVIPTE